MKYTAEDLINFELDVCKWWTEKLIRAPVHLDDQNAQPLIDIFDRHVNEDDWVMGTWRMHFKCLLKGVPQEELKQAILDGRSIGLCFPEYKIISSAIVGGILPIALGTALGIKRSGGDNKVVCFMGEMSSETGIAHECVKYSLNHDLPVLWVIEDNGKSVVTNTREVWGTEVLTYEQWRPENVLYFKYETRWPHAGTGERIQF